MPMTPQPTLLSLAESSPLLFFTYDHTRDVFSYANASCMTLGLKTAQFNISDLTKMVHIDDQPYIHERFGLLSNEKPIDLECRLLRAVMNVLCESMLVS
jgi:hypothetical protein